MSRIEKRLTYPVMLDWSGEVARSFAYPKAQAQVFVIGTDGTIVLKKSGAATASALAEIRSTIDRLQN